MKKRREDGKPKKEGKEPPPFNAAFSGLLGLAKELKRTGTERPVAPPPPPPTAPRREMSDEEMFLAEVADARPADPVPLPPRRPVAPPPYTTEDDEVVDHLDRLVAGEFPFEFTDSDEYVEGWVKDFPHRELKKLRAGDLAIEDHLDLHGRTRDEAKALVYTFIHENHLRGRRCVRIVHGRGLHSKDRSPVLKEALKAWLTRGWVAKQILAFTSALPRDGGAGAVYVLLRK